MTGSFGGSQGDPREPGRAALDAKVTVRRRGAQVWLTVDCANFTLDIPMTETQRNGLVYDLMNPKRDRADG